MNNLITLLLVFPSLMLVTAMPVASDPNYKELLGDIYSKPMPCVGCPGVWSIPDIYNTLNNENWNITYGPTQPQQVHFSFASDTAYARFQFSTLASSPQSYLKYWPAERQDEPITVNTEVGIIMQLDVVRSSSYTGYLGLDVCGWRCSASSSLHASSDYKAPRIRLQVSIPSWLTVTKDGFSGMVLYFRLPYCIK